MWFTWRSSWRQSPRAVELVRSQDSAWGYKVRQSRCDGAYSRLRLHLTLVSGAVGTADDDVEGSRLGNRRAEGTGATKAHWRDPRGVGFAAAADGSRCSCSRDRSGRVEALAAVAAVEAGNCHVEDQTA